MTDPARRPDPELAALLADGAPLADDGFTAGVMARLPRRAAGPSPVLAAIAWGAAAAVVAAAVPDLPGALAALADPGAAEALAALPPALRALAAAAGWAAVGGAAALAAVGALPGLARE